MTKLIAELREKYAIPFNFDYSGMRRGSHFFTFCDATIWVDPDGTSWESWMGLNADATSHEFKTIKRLAANE